MELKNANPNGWNTVLPLSPNDSLVGQNVPDEGQK